MGLLGQLAKSLIGGVVVSIHLDAVVDGGSVPMDHLSNLAIAKPLLRELVTEDVAGIDDGHVPILARISSMVTPVAAVTREMVLSMIVFWDLSSLFLTV